jgi:TolA-binding protein
MDSRLVDQAGKAAPPWDDLREERVLRAIQRARVPAGRSHRRAFAFAIGGFGLAAAAALSFWWMRSAPSQASRVEGATLQLEEGRGAVRDLGDRRELLLDDGSRVLLNRSAQVRVLEQAPTRTRLAQSAGGARYEVVPRRERAFDVEVAGVVVRVVGTVFEVTIEPEAVRVSVERGRVHVEMGARTIDLGAGMAANVLLEGVDPKSAGASEEEPRFEGEATDGRGSRAAVDTTKPRRRIEGHATAKARPEESSTKAPAIAPESVEQLLAEADDARKRRDLDGAAVILERVVREHPRDPQAPSAWFLLGRVERARSRHERAAEAFRSSQECAPSGVLAEDALAEEAIAWGDAGRSRDADARAKLYLERYPKGTHVARMATLLK